LLVVAVVVDLSEKLLVLFAELGEGVRDVRWHSVGEHGSQVLLWAKVESPRDLNFNLVYERALSGHFWSLYGLVLI
jgi:hypothetical protein